jgi:hypothetical protein
LWGLTENGMGAIGNSVVQTRQCAFCGKRIAVTLKQCPFCREVVPEVRLSSSRSGSLDGRQMMRRGLLAVLLAGVIHYFAAGYAMPLKLPLDIIPIVTNVLSPLLFLGGLGLTLYGLIVSAKS